MRFHFLSYRSALRCLCYYNMLLDGSSKFSDKAINEQMRIELKFRQSLSLTQLILLAELLWLLRIHYEDVATPHTADCCELYLLQVSTLY